MFEQQLIECRRERGDGRRWISLPMSLVVHVVVVGLAVGATLWSVDDVTDPPIPVSLYVAAPAPAVPRGRPTGPRPPPVQRPLEKPKPPQAIEAPNAIPAEVPTPLEQPEAHETGGGGDGVDGVPDDWNYNGGDLVGVLGPLAPEPTPEPRDTTIRVRAGIDLKEPKRLLEVKPIYPEVARRAGIQGVVILEVIVDTEGAVRDLRVLRGLPLGMTEAAEDAVRRWQWEPATYNGRPVEVYVNVSVIFKLNT